MKPTTPLVVLILGVLALTSATFLPMPNTALSQAAQVGSTPSISFVSSSYTVQEGNAVSVKIKADSPVQQTTRVKLQLQSGTARSGSDFAPVTATITFYRGGLTTKSLIFRTIRDSRAEGPETATVKMVSVNNRAVNKSATVTITDGPETGTGGTTQGTCASNEPCDTFTPWRPFSSKSTNGVMYQQKGTISFGGNQGSLVPFTSLSVIHPKVGNISISGKFNQMWAHSNTIFAPGNARNVAVPTSVLGIFSFGVPSNSPDYPTKTWVYEYINDTPTNSANGAGLPMRVVSKIPGDFNPNNVPAACRRSEPIGYGSMIFSIDPATKNLPNVCYLTPGQKYYINYVYATIEYSDASAYEKERIGLLTPWRPPTTPLTFDGNGKSARVVDTNNCAGDNGSGPVFPPACEQLWAMRDIEAGDKYIFIGSQENDASSKCNEFAPQYPGKKVYVMTNTTNTALSKLYRCDTSGPTLIPFPDTNF